MSDVVQTLWGFCHTLRHDGIDYNDYIEQLTYLLFLKMADERDIELPKDCDWRSLVRKSGTDLRDHYIDLLRKLGQQRGLLGDIFAGAQSRFNNPVNLKKLLGVIDETEWTALDIDVKAAAFEGLLEKAASEGKKGAGQYFTPRILIKALVRCMKPDPRTHPEFNICDPACGTGGFLVSSYEWLIEQTKGAFERDLAKRLKSKTYFGQELVQRPRRLTLMNLYLHGLEPHIALGDSIYEIPSGQRFDVVMTNPPFGTKGANQAPTRDDFTISTSNKQLNFIQHVMTILKPGGRAAVVVPDNCLFADQAGGVFKILTEDCNLHTVLRLPNGTFTPYSPSTKTNVIFFAKGYKTENIWVYDGRSNVPHITKTGRPLTREHLVEFEKCYGTDPNGRAKRKPDHSTEDRWRSFTIGEVKERDFKIDGLKWLKDESLDEFDPEIEPQDLAADAIEGLEAAVVELKGIIAMFESNGDGSAETARPTSGSRRSMSIAPRIKIEEIERESDGGLPEGWTQASLGQVILNMKNGLYKPATAYADAGVACLRMYNIEQGRIVWKDIKRMVLSDDELVEYGLVPGDLLVNRVNSRELVGKTAVFPSGLEPCVYESKNIRVRLIPELANPHYVNYRLLLSGQSHFNYHSQQVVGMASISQPQISTFPLPLAPRAEQDRIVSSLHRAFEAIDRVSLRIAGVAMAKVISRYDTLKQAILAKAFRGELVPTEAEVARREGRDYEPASVLLERIHAERVNSVNHHPASKRKLRKASAHV